MNHSIDINNMNKPASNQMIQDTDYKHMTASIEQFYTISAQSYYELSKQKIKCTLSQVSAQQKIKFEELSSDEIGKRCTIFKILYLFFQTLIEVDDRKYDNVCKKQSIFQRWVSELKINTQLMVKLNKIKDLTQPVSQHFLFLAELLFDAQIYVFQIMIRLMMLRNLYKKTEQFRQRLKQQYHRFNKIYTYTAPAEFNVFFQRSDKSFQRECKAIRKEISAIYNFYHCELIFTKSWIVEKRHLQYVIFDIFEMNCSKDEFVFIIRTANLIEVTNKMRKQKQIRQAKDNQKRQQLSKQPIKNISKAQEQADNYSNVQNEILIVQQKYERQCKVNYKEREVLQAAEIKLKKQENITTFISSQIKTTIEGVVKKRQVEHSKKKSLQKAISMKQKMKTYGILQRYNQNRNIFKYQKLKTHKDKVKSKIIYQDSIEDEPQPTKLRQSQTSNDIRQPNRVVKLQIHESLDEDSFLAEETPVQKKWANNF